MKKSSASLEASPYKSAAEELERLQKAFRSLSQRYSVRIETEIAGLREKILAAAEASTESGNGAVGLSTAHRPAPVSDEPGAVVPRPKPKAATAAARAASRAEASAKQTSQFHDLRDMLTLLRTFEITSPVAGRRDFKRVENVLEELQLLARHWA